MITDQRANPDIPRDPLPGLPVPDIFTELPQMPETVYIVGSGPNGEPHLPRIPVNAYAIALNSMVLYERKWAWWMAFDHRLPDPLTGWWQKVIVFKGTQLLFSSRLTNRIFTDETLELPILPDYYYKYVDAGGRHITGAEFLKEGGPLQHGYLLGGLTVAGCALQFAFYGGAKQVIFVGVDMEGQDHIDGHRNEDEVYAGTWPWAKKLSMLCGYMEREKGMHIRSLSPTRLEISHG